MNGMELIGGLCSCGQPIGHAGTCIRILDFIDDLEAAFDRIEGDPNRYRWPEDRR